MKIAWFSPFNKESAIGKYSKLAAETISQWADVEVFAYVEEKQTNENFELISTILKVNQYNSVEIINDLQNFDLCVYNMGNYLAYHAVIYDIMKLHPGIVVLHDVCMQHFYIGYYYNHLKRPNEYRKVLEYYYGREQAEVILNARSSAEKWNNIDFSYYNLLAETYKYSTGVIVHSDYHKSFIEDNYKGPILVAPLVYSGESSGVDNNIKFDKYDKNKINILTVGNINPNKHIDAVIRAIGQNDILKEKVHYTIIGSQENKPYCELLKMLIQEYELCDVVSLLGYVDDEELKYYYFYSDLVTNLRYPAYEGASATLVEQMLASKGIIVTDTGVYSEIPNNCVFKTDKENMVEEVAEVLIKIVNKPEILKEYEENALQYAKRTFSKEVYSEKVKKFFEELYFYTPIYDVIDTCKDSIRFMEKTEIKKAVSKEITDLFIAKNEA